MVECDEEYIGESSRTFGERFRGHLKAPYPIYDHFNRGHTTTLGEFQYNGEGGPKLHETYKRINIHKG